MLVGHHAILVFFLETYLGVLLLWIIPTKSSDRNLPCTSNATDSQWISHASLLWICSFFLISCPFLLYVPVPNDDFLILVYHCICASNLGVFSGQTSFHIYVILCCISPFRVYLCHSVISRSNHFDAAWLFLGAAFDKLHHFSSVVFAYELLISCKSCIHMPGSVALFICISTSPSAAACSNFWPSIMSYWVQRSSWKRLGASDCFTVAILIYMYVDFRDPSVILLVEHHSSSSSAIAVPLVSLVCFLDGTILATSPCF